IRPLSPQQITELRKKIQMINCSNCGAPIDLTKDSACPHCGSPLSMLDTQKMAEMVTAEGGASCPKQVPVPLLIFREASSPSSSLVDLGLQAVGQWLR